MNTEAEPNKASIWFSLLCKVSFYTGKMPEEGARENKLIRMGSDSILWVVRRPISLFLLLYGYKRIYEW